jgi:hypothetical protein
MTLRFDLTDVPESYYRTLFVARVQELISHGVDPDNAIVLAGMEIDLRIDTSLSSPLRAILANVTVDTQYPEKPKLLLWENGEVVEEVGMGG